MKAVEYLPWDSGLGMPAGHWRRPKLRDQAVAVVACPDCKTEHRLSRVDLRPGGAAQAAFPCGAAAVLLAWTPQ